MIKRFLNWLWSFFRKPIPFVYPDDLISQDDEGTFEVFIGHRRCNARQLGYIPDEVNQEWKELADAIKRQGLMTPILVQKNCRHRRLIVEKRRGYKFHG